MMHREIVELSAELTPLVENPPARPTVEDRNKLLSVRNKIKNLADDPDVTLTDSDDSDRAYLMMVATIEANRQEAFYEENGYKWA